MRRALRPRGRPLGAISATGEATRYGAKSALALHAASSGRFALRLGGELPESCGDDGRSGWAVDWTGMPRALELAEAEAAQTLVWALSASWSDPGWPLRLEGPRPLGAEDAWSVAHTGGHVRGELVVARETRLPSSLRFRSPLGDELLVFADWVELEGEWLPSRVEARSGESLSAVYELSSAARGPVDEEVFARPTARPDDTRFAEGAPAEVLVARGATGHLLARASLGAEVGWFVIDTGAGGSTILEAQTAARLRLPAVGSTAVGSVEGVTRAPVLRAPPITVGPLTLERPLVVAMELAFLGGIFEEPVVGILGWDLLARCVVEMTLAKDRLLLHDPARYALPADAAWSDLVIHTRHPVIRARYENSRHGLFRVDIGAAGALANVVFHTPTVEKERLLDDRDYEFLRVGTQDLALGPMLWFELDGHRFQRPVVAFARDHRGPFADACIDGNLGVGFLSPFTLVLDVPEKRYALVKVDGA